MTNSLQISTPDSAPPLEDKISPWMGPLAPWMLPKVATTGERARRWFLIWLVISILVHILILLIPVVQHLGNPRSSGGARGPLAIQIEKPAAPVVPSVEPPVSVSPPSVVVAKRPKTKIQSAFTTPSPSPSRKPTHTPTPTPSPTLNPVQPPVSNSTGDMMSDLNAKRAKREELQAALEDNAKKENELAKAADSEPSPEQKAKNNFNRSNPFSKEGATVLIRIKRGGVREGAFTLNGWLQNGDKIPEKTIPVDAGEGGNVHLAIVKKQIEMIRQYFPGDFRFESIRLGRFVPLSSRPADNAALEAFLMKEFFNESL